jgi:hypothetical protein
VNAGDRVELIAVSGDYRWFALTPGERGTIEFTDSLGAVHVRWGQRRRGRDHRRGVRPCPPGRRIVMTVRRSRPADPDLAAQFRGWEIERGTDGLMHAWLVGTDPPLVVSSEDGYRPSSPTITGRLVAAGSDRLDGDVRCVFGESLQVREVSGEDRAAWFGNRGDDGVHG